MQDEFASAWSYRLNWAYLLLVVALLMVPVFYNLYISFNELGFGAAEYRFTLAWYRVVFEDEQLMSAFGWTMLLAAVTVLFSIPFGILTAKLFKRTRHKVAVVALMLLPLFVPADIFASALLVFFKNLNRGFAWLSDELGVGLFQDWFELSFTTAAIGLVIYTLPYAFVVILITMGRLHAEQTEAARSCGATAWEAFWHIEFPQIRAGILASGAFVVILTFNEYTRTSMLKGGFDTFTTVLVSQMLNTGMSEQSYAMGGIVSSAAILVIGGILLYTLARAERLERIARAKAEGAAAG
ncbi:MAG: ABC transporter permease subunit [Gammaproteobacteria bacterium]|nr:ABC transporter permease subunit [Gammaproteobacteria bacterium]NIR84991.1 ABC transporter permease subunit [Gammaproteobacteria bacterium]NIR88258.1 ABC transporter permease subunit [Gammaproteobacteria bacterium]NIU06038.1 ABC transporter permease subunit [Gammaproteobacteria bacterium]NIV73457.1 ABC transporter permease subunit [Gammaproteobacteria bacterium]